MMIDTWGLVTVRAGSKKLPMLPNCKTLPSIVYTSKRQIALFSIHLIVGLSVVDPTINFPSLFFFSSVDQIFPSFSFSVLLLFCGPNIFLLFLVWSSSPPRTKYFLSTNFFPHFPSSHMFFLFLLCSSSYPLDWWSFEILWKIWILFRNFLKLRKKMETYEL